MLSAQTGFETIRLRAAFALLNFDSDAASLRECRLGPGRKCFGVDLTVNGKLKVDIVGHNAEGRTVHIGKRSQTVESAAPPGSHIHRLRHTGWVQPRMTKIAADELVHRELIEVRVLSGIEIKLIPGCAIEAKV